MNAAELIKTYKIFLNFDGSLFVRESKQAVKDGRFEDIKDKKEEIKAILKAEKEAERKAWAERDEKIAAIPGLKEIEATKAKISRWENRFLRSFEGEGACGGLGVGIAPKDNIEEMLKKYPQAAAYLKAKELSMKSNDRLSSIGSKAIDKIIDGDWEAAAAEMEREVKAFAQAASLQ